MPLKDTKLPELPDPPGPIDDKREHALSGAAIRLAAERSLPKNAPRYQRLMAPALTAIAKELADLGDQKHHTPDPMDAAATALGAALTYANGDFTAVPTLGRDHVGLDVVWRF